MIDLMAAINLSKIRINTMPYENNMCDRISIKRQTLNVFLHRFLLIFIGSVLLSGCAHFDKKFKQLKTQSQSSIGDGLLADNVGRTGKVYQDNQVTTTNASQITQVNSEVGQIPYISYSDKNGSLYL